MAKRKVLATQKARSSSSGRRYPGVDGKVVDYISHSMEDGTLCVNICFKDKTAFSLRFACDMFIVGAGHQRLEDRGLRDDSRVHEANSNIAATAKRESPVRTSAKKPDPNSLLLPAVQKCLVISSTLTLPPGLVSFL
jgi:hypothetical protein